jgi:hypothetical protein
MRDEVLSVIAHNAPALCGLEAANAPRRGQLHHTLK